jgi:hypothetical protein
MESNSRVHHASAALIPSSASDFGKRRAPEPH